MDRAFYSLHRSTCMNSSGAAQGTLYGFERGYEVVPATFSLVLQQSNFSRLRLSPIDREQDAFSNRLFNYCLVITHRGTRIQRQNRRRLTTSFVCERSISEVTARYLLVGVRLCTTQRHSGRSGRTAELYLPAAVGAADEIPRYLPHRGEYYASCHD